MKKRSPSHPRLYMSSQLKNNEIILSFVSNKFNSNGTRILETETVIANNINLNDTFLKNKNIEQLSSLKKYIKIQKKVLDKYRKARNYDSCRIINSSVSSMKIFEDEFLNWLKNY